MLKLPPPLCAVIVPCFNYGRFVTETIESVKAQTLTNFQCLIVDDGSTDNSVDVITEAIADDRRFTLLKKANGGVASARNYGIEHTDAPYICCIDSDDVMGSPLFLETMVRAMEANPSLGIAYTGLTVMTEAGELSPNVNSFPSVWDFDAQVEGHNQVPTCNMFRKEAWKRAGGYRSYLEPAEDANLWLRMGAIGYRAEQITTEGWFHYRVHANSLSRSKKEPVWNNFAWKHDNRRPFAAHGRTPSGTWAVRNYDKPLISIIVPIGTYHTRVLQRALDSIEGQSERRWECIVVNDSGETLNLPTWAREVKSDKRQAAGARNLGLQAATAPLVTFLDADDYWQLTFLERTLRAHQKTGRYAYTDMIMHQKDGTIGVHICDDYDPNALFQKPIPHGINMLLKREDALAVGGFDETMSTWEDVDFMMKLAIAGKCGVRVPEPLLVYDYRSGQLREKGMTDNRDKALRNQLHTRYLDYMEGRKMCSCDELPSGSSGTAQAMMSTFLQEGEETVRVELLQPAAPIEYIGKATRHSYQFRSRGDVFLVFRADYEADSENLVPLVVRDVKSVAIVPPPPMLIGELR